MASKILFEDDGSRFSSVMEMSISRPNVGDSTLVVYVWIMCSIRWIVNVSLLIYATENRLSFPVSFLEMLSAILVNEEKFALLIIYFHNAIFVRYLRTELNISTYMTY